MLKKALIASLICLGGLFSSSAAPTLGGPTLSATGGSTNSSSGGVDTNAVIALIEQYGGGGGVVSNTVVQLTVDTWYTNGQYPVVVEAQIELPNSAALMLFSVKDTNSAVIGYLPGSAAWNEFGNASKYAFATTTATEDNVQSLGGYVPAYAAFRYYASGTTASIYDNAPNGTRLVYFGSGTNSGSGSGVSAAQVAAIMVTNSPTISIVFEGDSLTHSNATSGTNTWANLISEANKISYRFVTTTNFAKAGDTLPTIISEYSAQAGGLTLSNRYNYFAICAGFNDIGGGAGSNNIKTYLTNIWRMATNSGYKVIASTITTNYTGSWTSGQAADYYAVNEWIKENPGYYSALLRPDLIINASPSLTGDGYHWTPAAQAAVAKQFNGLLFGGGDELLVASNLVVKSASTLLGETYLSGLVYSTNTIIFIPVDANYYKFSLGRYVSGGASLYNYQGITAIRGYGNNGFQVGNSSGTPILAISETGTISGNGSGLTNLLYKTNYVAAEFAPTSGYIKLVGSNNALYAVSATKTNLISAP